MANLDMTDKEALRHLLFPRGQNVVGFEENEDKFVRFFLQFGVNIKSPPYTAKKSAKKSGGDSQFTRFHIFLDKEDGEKVGKVIAGLVKHAEFLLEKSPFEMEHYPIFHKVDNKIISRCYAIAERLQREEKKSANQEATKSKKENVFADGISRDINFDRMPVEEKFKPILKNRLNEAVQCYKNETYLASIVMAGSVLEGALLGYAKKHPGKFENVKKIDTLPLAKLIDVCEKAVLLSKTAKEFGNVVRAFRNYIHPYGQISDKFEASKEDAEECLFGLKAILRRLK